jgi:hypothetical protein
VDSHFFDNVATGVGTSPGEGGGVSGGGSRGDVEVTSCTFSGNRAGVGGGLRITGGPDRVFAVSGCEFSLNDGGYGGAVYLTNAAQGSIHECVFSGNSGAWGASVASFWRARPQIVDCVFFDNTAPTGVGGVICCRYAEASAVLSGCTGYDNSASRGGVAYCFDGSVELESCTFVRNRATDQANAAVALYDTSSAVIENTIIALSEDAAAVLCADGTCFAALACTDIYGNAGGDWVGCIADQHGINGNFSADPLFCNPLADDFTLAEASPCAPENSPAGCGLIGALPVACETPIGVAVEAAPTVPGFLRVTPNPVLDDGTVEWATSGGPAVLRVYDPQGRLVLARDLGSVAEGEHRRPWRVVIGGRRLTPGVYFLEVKSCARAPTRVVVLR